MADKDKGSISPIQKNKSRQDQNDSGSDNEARNTINDALSSTQYNLEDFQSNPVPSISGTPISPTTSPTLRPGTPSIIPSDRSNKDLDLQTDDANLDSDTQNHQVNGEASCAVDGDVDVDDEDAAEATEEFNNDQIDRILENDEVAIRQQLLTPTNLQLSGEVSTVMSVSQGLPGQTLAELTSGSRISAEADPDKFSLLQEDLLNNMQLNGPDRPGGSSRLSQVITFSDLFNVFVNYVKKTISTSRSVTDKVADKVQMTFVEQVAAATRQCLNYTDAGFVFVPLAASLLYGFGCAYSLYYLRCNIHPGVTGMYGISRLWLDRKTRPVIALAPYACVALLYQQRNFENKLIFGDLKSKCKREIKDFSEAKSFLANMVTTKTVLSKFRQRMNSGNANGRKQSQNSNTSAGSGFSVGSSGKVDSLNLTLNTTKRKTLKPSTKDWDSISETASLEASRVGSVGVLQTGNSLMTQLVPENISDMNILKKEQLEKEQSKKQANITQNPPNIILNEGDNEDSAQALRRQYGENIAFKIKEENSSLRIISDLGLSLMLMPDFCELLTATGFWTLAYRTSRRLITPETNYADGWLESLTNSDLSSWSKAGLSLAAFMAVKSIVRISSFKSALL